MAIARSCCQHNKKSGARLIALASLQILAAVRQRPTALLVRSCQHWQTSFKMALLQSSSHAVLSKLQHAPVPSCSNSPSAGRLRHLPAAPLALCALPILQHDIAASVLVDFAC